MSVNRSDRKIQVGGDDSVALSIVIFLISG